MQISIKTPEKEHAYNLEIDKNSIKKVKDYILTLKPSKVCLLTDSNIDKLYPEIIKENFSEYPKIVIEAGEASKSFQGLQFVLQQMISSELDRKSLLICLGGGVVGDLGALAASLYHRGLKFIQIPTTLLAMIDSSVGGKTGIDFANQKNNIGTFYQPSGVFIDTNFLKSLPTLEMASGMSEVIKHGAVNSLSFFEYLENNLDSVINSSNLNVDSKKQVLDSKLGFCDILSELVYLAVDIKARLVEQDTKEGGQRKLLNFGHTFGHVLEMLSFETKHPLKHGLAVAWGMLFAARLSEQVLGYSEYNRLENLLYEYKILDSDYLKKLLTELLTGLSEEKLALEIFEMMKSDKKNSFGHINWTLLSKTGQGEIDQKVESEVVMENIFDFLKNYGKTYP